MAKILADSTTTIGRNVWCCCHLQKFCYNLPSTRYISVSIVRKKESPQSSKPASEVLPQNQENPNAFSSTGAEDIASQSSPDVFQLIDMANFGLGGWLPTDWTPYLFEVVYNYAHFPWWGCIVSVAVLARLALLPWWVKHRVKSGSVALVSEAIGPINKRMEEAKRTNDMQGVAVASSEMTRLYKEHNVTPFTIFKYPAIQGAAYLSIFWGLKDIVASVTGLDTGGALWFPNLMLPDPYYVLPVLSGIGLLTNVQCGEGTTIKENEFSRKVKFSLSVVSIVAIPLFATFPSGLLLYVATSSLCTFAQITLFKYPPVQQYFKFPDKMKNSRPKN